MSMQHNIRSDEVSRRLDEHKNDVRLEFGYFKNRGDILQTWVITCLLTTMGLIVLSLGININSTNNTIENSNKLNSQMLDIKASEIINELRPQPQKRAKINEEGRLAEVAR